MFCEIRKYIKNCMCFMDVVIKTLFATECWRDENKSAISASSMA